jgi:hypothetical protein
LLSCGREPPLATSSGLVEACGVSLEVLLGEGVPPGVRPGAVGRWLARRLAATHRYLGISHAIVGQTGSADLAELLAATESLLAVLDAPDRPTSWGVFLDRSTPAATLVGVPGERGASYASEPQTVRCAAGRRPTGRAAVPARVRGEVLGRRLSQPPACPHLPQVDGACSVPGRGGGDGRHVGAELRAGAGGR